MISHTEQKIIEIFENASYAIGFDQQSGFINAYKVGCAEITAYQTNKTMTGWAFNVGKNTLSCVYDAIRFSKEKVMS